VIATTTLPHSLSLVSGLQLEAYREEHVRERIRRTLEREGVSDVEELTRVLGADPDTRARFRRSVSISHSGLFRDPAQFDLLERELLPRLLETRRRLTVWSAGCADGSELYSVAILIERLGASDRAVLLGSDLLEENLALAAKGVYGDVSISPALRKRARFERRDLLADDPPPGKWRLVLCRNVAIYLAPEAKRRLHALLAGSLAAGGVLLVGRSERIADPASLGLERIAPHAYEKAAR
jgi:chemotaxis protein methyltransferase CheR